MAARLKQAFDRGEAVSYKKAEHHIPVWVMEPLRGGRLARLSGREEAVLKRLRPEKAVTEDKRPSVCIGCRSCEAVCPQRLKISGAIADFAGLLRQQ